MHFNGRKKKNIVSSTRSADNGLGFSTFNDILGSRSSSPEISQSFARNEINRYFSDDVNSNMGDSTKFMPLTDMGSVSGEPEPPIDEVERMSLGSDDPDSSTLSTRDLEPRHRNQYDTSDDSDLSGRIKIIRNEKTGSYHFKIRYNK